MAEKITPPVKKVDRADGFKQPTANTTLTTPVPTFGRYYGSGKPGSSGDNGGENSLFDSSLAH